MERGFDLGHRPALDGLRGAAVLCVLGFHARVPFLRWGYLGVDVFFVLSGFLITSVLLREWAATGDIRLRSFYARRALRLLPALLALLALSLLPAGGPDLGRRVRSAAVVLFYGSNWARAFDRDVLLPEFEHTWSLSIEEQFYVLWPVALALALRKGWPARRIAGLLASGALVAAAGRAAMWSAGFGPERLYNGLDTRADGLLAGCLLGVALASGLRPGVRNPSVAPALAVAALPFAWATFGSRWDDAFMFVAGYAGVAIASAASIAALVVERPRWLHRLLSSPPLVRVGRISYGLYLWHYPLFLWVDRLGLPRVPGALAKAAGVLAVASLSYRWIERPFLRLKDRFEA